MSSSFSAKLNNFSLSITTLLVSFYPSMLFYNKFNKNLNTLADNTSLYLFGVILFTADYKYSNYVLRISSETSLGDLLIIISVYSSDDIFLILAAISSCFSIVANASSESFFLFSALLPCYTYARDYALLFPLVLPQVLPQV